MPWPDIIGHERVLDRFRQNLKQGRLASTFLFVGPAGVGKRTTALKLAQSLLCESRSPSALDACLTCPGCRQATSQTHPDLILIAKPAEKNFIPVELFIGDREHRMREGLCHDIALTPFRGGRKIAIIDDADHLNQEVANCLLKTLEEPPSGSLIILVGTSEQRQLPTIRSRCQIVRFSPLTDQQVAELLRRHMALDDNDQIKALAARADGSLHRAIELADTDLEDERRSLLMQLSQRDSDVIPLIKEVASFVDAAGKDAPSRRARMRQVIHAAIEFYRHLMRDLAEAGPSGDDVADQFVAAARKHWTGDAQSASLCLDRCLEAFNQVDMNANLATLVACWLDDLSQMTLRATSKSHRA